MSMTIGIHDVCNWKHLERVAIEHHDIEHNGSTTITYFEVDKASKVIKEQLNNVGHSEFIGISSDVPVFCIPSLILGIISSGRAFVYLAENSQLMSEFLNIKYIFSSKHCASKDIITFEEIIIHSQKLNLLQLNQPSSFDVDDSHEDSTNSFAYAVTTSGSTGTPVVVKVTHASILPNIIQLRETFSLSINDKIAQLTPLTFDPSIVEIFLSLSCGGTLFTASEKLKNNYEALLASFNKHQITFISTTPSLLLNRWPYELTQSTILAKESKLRVLLLGGELFPTSDILQRIKHYENCTQIYNIYGITEVSCWASINPLLPGKTIIPEDLGVVLKDTIFQVRDNEDNVLDEGEGILFIGSNQRICAINDEKLCNLKPPVFRNTGDIVEISKTGKIRLKGRRDNCIKRFGNKVYLNDLKFHIEQLFFVINAQVIWSNISSTLNLFFTVRKHLHHDRKILIEAVWKHIKKVPVNLHPDNVYLLDEFKVTGHGKIRQDSLKKFCANSDARMIFGQIWKNHIPSGHFGFLDAGGTSILALQMSNAFVDKTERHYPQLIGMLLENKTLEECQKYISEDNRDSSLIEDSNLVTENLEKALNDASCSTYKIKKCLWQKCRGKTISLDSIKSSQTSNSHVFQSTNIKLKNIYNLNKCVDASPTVFQNTNGQIFVSVGSHSGIICTVDIYKNLSWKIELPNRIEASIFVFDEFRAIVGCHDGFIYCIHLLTGNIFWKFQTGNMVKCLAVADSRGENIFIGSYDRFLYCLTSKEGKLLWKKAATSVKATPLIDDDALTVIFGLLDGSCLSIDQLTGRIRWKYNLQNPIFSSPVLSRQKIAIFADVHGNISALDSIHGHKLWEFSTSSQIFSDLVIYNDHIRNSECLIFASKNGIVTSYDLNDFKCPKLKYEIGCGKSIIATPWVENKMIIVVRENGELEIRDVDNGKIRSYYKLAGDCFSSPVLYQNLILLGCRDNNLYILKLM